jgi:hypothetical protein
MHSLLRNRSGHATGGAVTAPATGGEFTDYGLTTEAWKKREKYEV